MLNSALYMDRYPLVSAISRPLIKSNTWSPRRLERSGTSSRAAAARARPVDFEVRFASLAPDLEVLAPVRDYAWTRGEGDRVRRGERDPDRKRSPFSIDQNVWGRAVETGWQSTCGMPNQDIYAPTKSPTEAAHEKRTKTRCA